MILPRVITMTLLYLVCGWQDLAQEQQVRHVDPQPIRPVVVSRTLDREDLELLAATVYAEANTESYDGKVAVASVVLNRLETPRFSKTIPGVVAEGQFYTGSGRFNQECIDAVKAAWHGYRPAGDALYFCRYDAEDTWMKNNRELVIVIGAHEFYR